jgi:hypothetical protein
MVSKNDFQTVCFSHPLYVALQEGTPQKKKENTIPAHLPTLKARDVPAIFALRRSRLRYLGRVQWQWASKTCDPSPKMISMANR